MRRLARYLLLLTLVAICFVSAFAQGGGAASKKPLPPPPPAPEYNPNNWKQFSSEAGRFTALFPGTPTEAIRMVNTAVGNLAMHLIAMRSAAEYAVTYTDFPQNLEKTGSAKQHLDNGRDKGVQGVQGRLLEEKEFDIEGHPGRYIKVQTGSGATIRSKMFIVENRLYSSIVVTNDQGASDAILKFHEEIAAKFLDSFKLTTGQKVLGEVDELLSKGSIYVLGSKDGASKTLGDRVLNGRAISLPRPPYPPIARAARASGTVVVKVVVDETGKVIAAQVESGHPLLQAAALQAARAARFDPPLLDGKPIKVAGIINYNFTLDEIGSGQGRS